MEETMADSSSNENGANGGATAQSFEIKVGLAEMLKGGVIMDVTNPDQAKIAEDSGAAAVMALERVPSDIRRDGGVARMCSIEVIEGIQRMVSIPVMAKVRIGHFAEARILEALGVEEALLELPRDVVGILGHVDVLGAHQARAAEHIAP